MTEQKKRGRPRIERRERVTTPLGKVTLEAYAPGDGALAFTFVRHHPDGKREAFGSDPTIEEARAQAPEGWAIGKISGCLRAWHPVARTGDDTLTKDARQYRYGVEFEGNGWRRYWFKRVGDDDDLPVVNVNTTGALKFYLDHEDEIKTQTNTFEI